VRAMLDVGDVRRAERAMAGVRSEQTLLRLRARIDLARGEREAAKWAVSQLRPQGPRRQVETSLLAARAGLDDRAAARRHVAHALAIATEAGFTWTVAREDELVPLVAEVAPASRFAGFCGIVHLRPHAPAELATVTEHVSTRELAVLRLLPSHLGTRELAGALGVSPNTVKTHVKSLYRKLGVSSRSDAVHLARDVGLLPLDDAPALRPVPIPAVAAATPSG